jgi:hypothetical protein
VKKILTNKIFYIFLLVVSLLYLTASWMACSEDGENISGPQEPSADLTGSWLVNQTISGNCPGENYPITRMDIYAIRQSGNDLQITTASSGESFAGIISANNLSWEMTVPEDDGELSFNFTGTVADNGQSVSGQATWTWSMGNLSCSGTADITAVKVTQPISDVSGTWSGTWQSENAGINGEFEAKIIQQDTSLSGSITIPDLALNNADLKGTVRGNTMAFGDIDDQITFIGILGTDTVSASGTYYYPTLDDYGSWTATKSGSLSTSGLQILASFPIPDETGVTDMAYDGTNLWILAGADNLYKFSTSGEYQGTYLTPGSYPVGVTFDGKDLRIADSDWGNSKIFSMNPDGSTILKAPGYGYSRGLATDGVFIWAADDDFQNPQIFKMHSDGTIIDSISGTWSQVKGLTYDGHHLWVSARENADSKILKLDLNGNVLDSFEAPAFFTGGLTFDGSNLWFSDYSAQKIYLLDTLGTVLDTIDAPCQYVGDLAFDGTDLWALDEGVVSSYKIYQISTTGNVISSIETPGNSPAGLTYFNGYLWNCNYVSKKIYKLTLSEPYFSDLPEFEFSYLTYDGSYLWADDMSSGKIHPINEQGQIVQSLDLPCTDIGGIVYYDSHFWIVCTSGFSFDTLYQMDMSGNITAFYQSDEEIPEPCALTTDGTNLWYVGQEPYSWSFVLHKLGLKE